MNGLEDDFYSDDEPSDCGPGDIYDPYDLLFDDFNPYAD